MTNDGFVDLKTPIPSLFSAVVMHTSSVSMSLQGAKTLAKTESPTLMSGLFFFVAPSKANKLSDASSFVPMSILACNPPTLTTVPITRSPLIGTY